MRRRGCLFGVGGVFLALVLCGVLGYFVALPRFHDQIEEELTRVLSTAVADAFDREAGSIGSVGPGEYRISLSDLEREVTGGSDNLQVEGLTLRGEGSDIVVTFSVPDARSEFRFTPQVSSEGYLEMGNVRGEGGIVERLLAPESIGSAVENSVNSYLQASGLYLQDVAVGGDVLVFSLADR